MCRLVLVLLTTFEDIRAENANMITVFDIDRAGIDELEQGLGGHGWKRLGKWLLELKIDAFCTTLDNVLKVSGLSEDEINRKCF